MSSTVGISRGRSMVAHLPQHGIGRVSPVHEEVQATEMPYLENRIRLCLTQRIGIVNCGRISRACIGWRGWYSKISFAVVSGLRSPPYLLSPSSYFSHRRQGTFPVENCRQDSTRRPDPRRQLQPQPHPLQSKPHSNQHIPTSRAHLVLDILISPWVVSTPAAVAAKLSSTVKLEVE